MSEDSNLIQEMVKNVGVSVVANVITSAPKWMPKSLLFRSQADERVAKDAFGLSLYRAYLDTVEKYPDAARYGFNEEMLQNAELVLQKVFDPRNYRDFDNLSKELIEVWANVWKMRFPTYNPEQVNNTHRLMSDVAPDFLAFFYRSLQEREVFTSFFTNRHHALTEEYNREEIAELKNLTSS